MGVVLAKSHNLTSVFVAMELYTVYSVRRSSPRGMVVSKTSRKKDTKRKVTLMGQISRRDKSRFSRERRLMCTGSHMLRGYLKTKFHKV